MAPTEAREELYQKEVRFYDDSADCEQQPSDKISKKNGEPEFDSEGESELIKDGQCEQVEMIAVEEIQKTGAEKMQKKKQPELALTEQPSFFSQSAVSCISDQEEAERIAGIKSIVLMLDEEIAQTNALLKT